VRKVTVPWASRNTGFTLMYEAYIMTLLELEMSPSSVADLVKVWPRRIWDVFNHYVGLAKSKSDDSGIESVGIDETSRAKGHDYVTLGVDLGRRRVFKVVPGKDAAAVRALADHLDTHGSPEVSRSCMAI
jgi:transposase